MPYISRKYNFMYVVSIITKFYKGTGEKFVELCGSIIIQVVTQKNRAKNDKKIILKFPLVNFANKEIQTSRIQNNIFIILNLPTLNQDYKIAEK